jgi:predicted metal-dependent hydrolase
VSTPARRDPPPFTVEVVRSRRRRKSVGGLLVGDTLKVTVPSWMSKHDEARAVAEMTRRFARRFETDRVDLPARAARLARTYDLPAARDIAWSETMRSRWGSCTPSTGSLRISSRLAPFPDWVLDYVIVHELAHLAVPDHSSRFWRLVERFPRAERARGYLIAKSGDVEGE